MNRDELRDGINRILFHVLSNEERADKIAELIEPELKKAQEVDKFITSCTLNPFYGLHTCKDCFCRVTCAKNKTR